LRAARVFAAVDSHTEGMPTRVVTGGVGPLPGATMLERKAHFEAELDDLRRLLMREPRGHGAMSGAILQPPTREDADWGVLFIEVSGCLPMCGHGTIGVATVLVETGMVAVTEPETIIRLDTPAGLVEVRVAVSEGAATAVTLRNVPAFLERRDAIVELGGRGSIPLVYDLAFGGNFYAIVDAATLELEVDPERAPELIDAGARVMAAIEDQDRPVHPEDERIAGLRHVIFTAPGHDGADARAAVSIHPGWLDRSPCGTGTSARMAQLHARGELALNTDFVHESVIGTRFTGRLVGETEVGGRPAVIPEITGRAWITGMGQYLLDPSDPFPAGFSL
jgi:proline racemase